MKIENLLFGGSGFVGNHLANCINDEGKKNCIILDIVEPISKSTLFEKVDVRETINTNFQPSEDAIIFNLAAVHRTPGHPSNEYFETNLLGAENVCNYARKYNINTIVFTSSIAVYGTYEAQKSETTLPMPDIPYGISKLIAENIHKLWQMEAPTKRRLIIIRPGVVFGQHENGNFTRLINSMAKKRFLFPGRKDTIKACIYVKDLVYAMFQMLENEREGVCTYNMTYEPAPSIEKICNIISKKGSLSEPKVKLPSFLMLLAARLIYGINKKEEFHPDRVKKLMISNNINGALLNSNYNLKFGLDQGVDDWIKDSNFKENMIIH